MVGNTWVLPLLQCERYEFIRPTDDGIEHIAQNLRESDREEAHASFGHRDYLKALRLAVDSSDHVVMGVSAFSEPVALLGVSTLSVLYGTGSPWMVATDHADRYRRAYIECGRFYTRCMLGEYTALENHVDARNLKSVAWLKRVGYSIGEPVPYGALGMPFHPFRIERT